MAFLLQHCYLVVVAVPTAEAARRIFTVLNARGLDLTPTDILKAQLLERAGPTNETPLANRWEQVEQALGRDRMVELFGHIRMVYERDKPRLALEDGFCKFVPAFSGKAHAFISDVLEPISDCLRLLYDSTKVQKYFGIEAAKAVRSLQRIDNKDWSPDPNPKRQAVSEARKLQCRLGLFRPIAPSATTMRGRTIAYWGRAPN